MTPPHTNGHAPVSDDADYTDPEAIRAVVASLREADRDAAENVGGLSAAVARIETAVGRLEKGQKEQISLAYLTQTHIAQLNGDRKISNNQLRKTMVVVEELRRQASTVRGELDSFSDEVTETGRRSLVDAKEAAKIEADRVRLEIAKDTLAEVKEVNRHWGRWTADKAFYVVAGVIGALALFALQKLFGGH